MTSKEALERLKDDIEINYLSTKHSNEKDKSNYLILLNSIEKDLEILDILKNESDSKRIIERDGIVSFHLDMILTIDNYNKIKEWLENDKSFYKSTYEKQNKPRN